MFGILNVWSLRIYLRERNGDFQWENPSLTILTTPSAPQGLLRRVCKVSKWREWSFICRAPCRGRPPGVVAGVLPGRDQAPPDTLADSGGFHPTGIFSRPRWQVFDSCRIRPTQADVLGSNSGRLIRYRPPPSLVLGRDGCREGRTDSGGPLFWHRWPGQGVSAEIVLRKQHYLWWKLENHWEPQKNSKVWNHYILLFNLSRSRSAWQKWNAPTIFLGSKNG